MPIFFTEPYRIAHRLICTGCGSTLPRTKMIYHPIDNTCPYSDTLMPLKTWELINRLEVPPDRIMTGIIKPTRCPNKGRALYNANHIGGYCLAKY
jgi:hypothetical protein